MSRSRLVARALVLRRGTRAILDGVSLTLGAGEAASIEGASGSGKSTLLRILGLLIEPDGGSILLDGSDRLSMAPEAYRRRVAYVAQSPRMLEGTVRDNLAAGLRYAGRALEPDAAASLLARVGLEPDLAGRAASSLSGGEALRVAFARALAHQPEVLLLDEPTSALDGEAAVRIVALGRALAASGLAVLMVTHAPDHAEALGGARHRLHQGRLLPDEAR